MSTKNIIQWAKETLSIESAALISAGERLNGDFTDAVKTILKSNGKVVLTGLGKSGHVAKKIAATFASTGTPSFFIHPSEALHGDLGMIGSDDVIIAIAYGGETYETLRVAKFGKKINIPVISITGKVNSSLAEISDYCLDGSIDKEACPNNLAPTASTTLAMGLGDALAVSLMRSREFSSKDFAEFHPDGSLGRRLSTVSNYMKKDILSLKLNDSFTRALEVMTAKNYGISAVLDEDNYLVGAMTDGDIRRALIKKDSAVFAQNVEALMTSNPKSIPSTTLAIEAVSVMEEFRITSLFVTDEHSGNLVGILRMHDLISAKVV